MAAPMYEVVSSVTADGNVPVTKYKSLKTGLNVCIAQVEGPLVNGYFCLGNLTLLYLNAPFQHRFVMALQVGGVTGTGSMQRIRNHNPDSLRKI